jgi:hypothetical protein
MPNFWSKLFLLSTFLSVATFSLAQRTTSMNAPYSRYGMGNLASADMPALQSMGGIASAYNNPFQLNIANPASLAFLSYTSFETGGFAEYTRITTSNNNEAVGNWNGNISHFALGFPLKNPIARVTEVKRSPFSTGMAFGLLPFSTVGYDITNNSTLPDIGDVTYNYKGGGRSYQAFLSMGSKYKGLAIGGHLGYIFGGVSKERSLFFDEQPYTFGDVFREEYAMKGLMFRFGLQYEYIIGKSKDEDGKTDIERPRITLGLHGNTATNLSTEGSSIAARTNFLYNGSNLDTILASVNTQGTLTLPSEIGVGLTYSKMLHWKFGVDFKMSTWSAYQNTLDSETLADTWRIAVGGEYIPDVRSYNKYSKKLRYRAGFHYGTDPRVVGGEQLTRYGVTAGLGFPLRLPRGVPSFTSVGLEYGKLSATDLISENYFRINVGFTLNDNTWFYKQKFN